MNWTFCRNKQDPNQQNLYLLLVLQYDIMNITKGFLLNRSADTLDLYDNTCFNVITRCNDSVHFIASPLSVSTKKSSLF